MTQDSSELSPTDLRRIHGARLVQRDIDQLLGICEFTLQDGVIDQEEAEAIYDWLKNHRSCLDTWPASIIYERLRAMLADGKLDDDEQGELLSLVMQIARPRTSQGIIVPTSLPLDTPAPEIIFPDRQFCFTGVFDFGSRNDCMAAVEKRGGIASKGITKKLHYLVIGNIGSESWKFTSFGSKIEKAVEYRENGAPIAIVSETHWASAVA